MKISAMIENACIRYSEEKKTLHNPINIIIKIIKGSLIIIFSEE
jgi:hypothetical protein